MSSVGDLFGVPTYLSSVECQRWIILLNRTWFALMGRPPAALQQDLNALAAIFGTGVSARTLRERVYKLPAMDEQDRELPIGVAIALDGCLLITPEGRILLDVLLDLQRAGEQEIKTEVQMRALNAASSLRLQWQAAWMEKQFSSSMSPAVLGAAIFLLLNGSVGVERALLLANDPAFDSRLGAVVQPLIAGFSEALGREQPSKSPGLRGFWALSQVSRLMGRDVAREASREGALMYVKVGGRGHLIREIAARLDRLKDPSRVHVAVLDLVEGYRNRRGALAALEQMHEDPTNTRRIVDTLLNRGADL